MKKHHHEEDEAIKDAEETAEWLCDQTERDNERLAEESAEFEALFGGSKHRQRKEHADRGRASRRETR